MNNMNFDENTINHLKNMLNNGDLNNVISQIPPEMIKNFSSMMKNNTSNETNSANITSQNSTNNNYNHDNNNNIKKDISSNSNIANNNSNNNLNSNINANSNNNNINTNSNINTNNNSNINNNNNINTNSNNPNTLNDFDFSKIDMNTILKVKSVMEKLNNSDDSRSNLLYSLKPYLRESRKEKLDQYANLLNVAKIADLFKKTE